MRRVLTWLTLAALVLPACGREGDAPPGAEVSPGAPGPAAAAAPAAPPELPNALAVAISYFEQREGKPVPHSRLLLLARRDGRWQAVRHEDPESNVFHKALAYAPPGGEPGILTLGGSAAALKLWRPAEGGLTAQTLWQKDFGGKFSRMRDAEVGALDGDGKPVIAVATHDQGVVALVRPDAGGFAVEEIDQEPDTFVHEIELGDLDADGVLEVYATPSDPNKLDGEAQHGEVVRYVPGNGEGRTVVADLGGRHAKEILVDDVDGDGVDELYVSIEAAEGGDVEIRRYDADTPPHQGVTIATLEDPMCRFLTAGDPDGDGKRQLVAAAKDSGLWLLTPGEDPLRPWALELIDADSKGFEHAALFADLDEDGVDELYVASDRDRELRRYVWTAAGPARETIHRHAGSEPLLTWNLMPVPGSLVP